MNTWTSAAQDELNRYLDSLRPSLERVGADAGEVIEDIKRHLSEEAAAAHLRVVTVADLKGMLARMGEPWLQPEMAGGAGLHGNGHSQGNGHGAVHTVPLDWGTVRHDEVSTRDDRTVHVDDAPAEPGPVRPKKNQTYKVPGAVFAFFGIVLPGLTLLIEWVTGFCAANIFNPIPTLGHAALVAIVPITNAVIWRCLRRGALPKWEIQLSWALNIALGIALSYSAVFLPLALPGIFALIFFGLGLLPLSPLLALGATISLRRSWNRFLQSKGVRESSLWPAILCSVMALLLIDLPFLATSIALRMADSPQAERRSNTLRWLKKFGHEPTLLRACYPTSPASGPLYFWPSAGISMETARALYFQITGKPFNAVQPPRTGGLFRRTMAVEPWDPERGGDKVGAPVTGLELHSSRMDATVDPGSALAYLEWILEFKNHQPFQTEARSEILLPPGSVVSRLSLWVNGEEREAAFAGKSQVREAYEKVVAQRRDPVLVTMSGPDRVHMQCFPVPPNGGLMKVRLGMTIPLQLDEQANGILRWPLIAERNFALDQELKHAFWLESPAEVQPLVQAVKVERTASGSFLARGNVVENSNSNLHPALLIKRDSNLARTWVYDTRSKDGAYIVQTLQSSSVSQPKNIVVVLDGSVALNAILGELSKMAISGAGHIQVVFASEPIRSFSVRNPEDWAREFQALSWDGGQDNIPALVQAWDLAAENGPGLIIWVHGPHPVLLSSLEPLKQRFERRPRSVELLDMQLERGPNKIIAELPSNARWRSVSMHYPAGQTLERLLRQLRGEGQTFEMVRQRVNQREKPTGKEANLHLARAWAFDEVNRLIANGDTRAALELAALYQLVTPVSGAVVLESEQQFADAGLTAVDKSSVPVVPEPGAWALLFIGLGFLFVLRLRKAVPPNFLPLA